MSNTYRVRVFTIVLMLLVCILPSARGQEGVPVETDPDLEPLEFGPLEPEPEPPVGFIERRTEAGNYSLAKRSIPLYELVRGLLPQTGHFLTAIGDVFLEDSLGIKKGTVQERALLTAILAATEAELDNAERADRRQELIALRIRESADASRLRNRELMLEDARRIGVVWGRLVADLGGGSPAMVRVSAYVEKRRFSMSISSNESFEGPNHMIWRTERAFQAGVSSVLSDN